jgi:hypothetical protein
MYPHSISQREKPYLGLSLRIPTWKTVQRMTWMRGMDQRITVSEMDGQELRDSLELQMEGEIGLIQDGEKNPTAYGDVDERDQCRSLEKSRD